MRRSNGRPETGGRASSARSSAQGTTSPLGSCLTLGLFDNFFGDASFIVRRSVFEALGGFSEEPEYRSDTHEDYEFLLRLVLAGKTLDVVPEVLLPRHGQRAHGDHERVSESPSCAACLRYAHEKRGPAWSGAACLWSLRAGQAAGVSDGRGTTGAASSADGWGRRRPGGGSGPFGSDSRADGAAAR